MNRNELITIATRLRTLRGYVQECRARYISTCPDSIEEKRAYDEYGNALQREDAIVSLCQALDCYEDVQALLADSVWK